MAYEQVVGVVVGEHRGAVQRQLLGRVPDSVVGARLAEVIAGGHPLHALRLDEREERFVGAIDGSGIERPGEDDHPGAVGERPDQFGLQRPPVAARHGLCRVDEDVAADPVGERIVAELGVAVYFGAERVQAEIGLVQPRCRRRAHWCSHGS